MLGRSAGSQTWGWTLFQTNREVLPWTGSEDGLFIVVSINLKASCQLSFGLCRCLMEVRIEIHGGYDTNNLHLISFGCSLLDTVLGPGLSWTLGLCLPLVRSGCSRSVHLSTWCWLPLYLSSDAVGLTVRCVVFFRDFYFNVGRNSSSKESPTFNAMVKEVCFEEKMTLFLITLYRFFLPFFF